MNIKNRVYKQQLRTQNNFEKIKEKFSIQKQFKVFKGTLQWIQTSLQMMNTAFRNNIKIQEIYLDLIKAKGKKINFKTREIKKVYEILSENKTDEIYFQIMCEKDQAQRKSRQQQLTTNPSFTSSRFKQQASAKTHNRLNSKAQQLDSICQNQRNSQVQQFQIRNSNEKKTIYSQNINTVNLTYRRLYSRLIEAIVKKVTFYILNKNILQTIILQATSQTMKKLQILVRRLTDFRDSKFLFQVIKIIYEQNFIIQQKIYEVIVNQGYVMSIQQFFRVNGILMEQTQTIKRPLRVGFPNQAGTKSAILGKSDFIAQEREDVIISKKNKFYQNNLKLKNNKKSQGYKNIQYIQKTNKQIESKYAVILDKIGQLIDPKQNMTTYDEQNDNRDSNLQSDKIIEVSQNSQQENQQELSTQGRRVRQSQERRVSSKKKSQNQQYFSAQFKEIIHELEQKKGRTFIVPTGRGESFSQLRQGSKSKTMFNFQSPRLQKYNNQTISLQNPINVARLLGRKISKFSPALSQYSCTSQTRNPKKPVPQKRQINKLLKICQNNNKQNHYVDILFDYEFADQQHKNLQKNFIKLNIITKLKEKGLSKLIQSDLSNQQMQSGIMRQIQMQYEQLFNTKIGKSSSSQNSLRLNNQILRYIQTNIINSLRADKKRKTIAIFRSPQAQPNLQAKLVESANIQPDYLSPVSPTQTSAKQNGRNYNIRQNCCKSEQTNVNSKRQRFTHQIPTIKQIDQKRQRKLGGINICNNNIYGQFTNPLTSTCGYYNQQKYTSLRGSLQKCQLNTLKQKKGILKKSQFSIGANVSFWNKFKTLNNSSKNQNSLVRKNLLLHKSSLIHKNIQESNEKSTQENKNLRIKQIKDGNMITQPFKNTKFDKFYQKMQGQAQGKEVQRIQGEQFMKPKNNQESLKYRKSQNVFRSNGLRNNIKEYSLQQNKLDRTYEEKKKISQRGSSLERDFCFHSQKINIQNKILTTDDLDSLIQNFLQKSKQFSGTKNNFLNLQKYLQLFTPNSSVSSLNRHKQIYSTARRMKVQ